MTGSFAPRGLKNGRASETIALHPFVEELRLVNGGETLSGMLEFTVHRSDGHAPL
jgi:hypothetical protein